MIVDTSAILAILLSEPEADEFESKIANSWPIRMSVASLLEATMVTESKGSPLLAREMENYLATAQFEFVPVTLEQAEAARVAWRRFGKGNHPAHLNFGDCFSYALAKTTGEPLLFKGNDFSQTDIQPA